MKYILYLLLIAVIFGLVALVDFLLGKLFPSRSFKRRARPCACPGQLYFGALLFLIGLIAVLFLSSRPTWRCGWAAW